MLREESIQRYMYVFNNDQQSLLHINFAVAVSATGRNANLE